MASDSTKKIAKKAAPKKYSASASGKAVRVKRDDSPNKIAKRHRVKEAGKPSGSRRRRRSKDQA